MARFAPLAIAVRTPVMSCMVHLVKAAAASHPTRYPQQALHRPVRQSTTPHSSNLASWSGRRELFVFDCAEADLCGQHLFERPEVALQLHVACLTATDVCLSAVSSSTLH